MRKVFIIIKRNREDYFATTEKYYSKTGWKEFIQEAELFEDYPINQLQEIKEQGIYIIQELFTNIK